MAGKDRKFVSGWFDEYALLEYSVTKDAAFCLCCYLFKNECGNSAGGDAFVNDQGFTYWKNKEKLRKHEGGLNSCRAKELEKCNNLLKQQQHIESSFAAKIDYRIQLSSSIKCGRFLLHHGLPFRGHDESNNSNNRGLYIDILQFVAHNNAEISNVGLNNAKGNLKLIAPAIQRDIVKAAQETTNLIIKELDNGLFSVLIDEAHDVSTKEKMAVVLRFVNKKGCVVQRFLGLKKVSNTTSISLEKSP